MITWGETGCTCAPCVPVLTAILRSPCAAGCIASISWANNSTGARFAREATMGALGVLNLLSNI